MPTASDAPLARTSHTTEGQAIHALRERLGLTQEQLAHQLGVTAGTVQRWERGEAKPSPLARRQLGRLARRKVAR